MAKKNFEKGLEKLFSNVQSSEPTEEKEEAPVKDESAADEQNNSRRGRPALHNKVIRFCTMADDDKVTKIRTIAAREGIAIKDLMNLAFDKIINEYEKKYGVVRLPKVKRKVAMFPRSLTFPNLRGISVNEVPFFFHR